MVLPTEGKTVLAIAANLRLASYDELFEEGDEGFDTPLDFPDLDIPRGATP